MVPHSAEFHTNLGMALGVLGRAEEAMAQYRRALVLDPRFERARMMMMRTQRPAAEHK